jgi:hypothetical protein
VVLVAGQFLMPPENLVLVQAGLPTTWTTVMNLTGAPLATP